MMTFTILSCLNALFVILLPSVELEAEQQKQRGGVALESVLLLGGGREADVL